MGLLNLIFGVGAKALEKIWPDRSKLVEQHLAIHAETERSSGGRITPYKVLGFLLVLGVAWEIFLRPVLVFYWPDVEVPPSMLKEIMLMASTYFGMGF